MHYALFLTWPLLTFGKMAATRMRCSNLFAGLPLWITCVCFDLFKLIF